MCHCCCVSLIWSGSGLCSSAHHAAVPARSVSAHAPGVRTGDRPWPQGESVSMFTGVWSGDERSGLMMCLCRLMFRLWRECLWRTRFSCWLELLWRMTPPCWPAASRSSARWSSPPDSWEVHTKNTHIYYILYIYNFFNFILYLFLSFRNLIL